MSFAHYKVTTATTVTVSAVDTAFGDVLGSPKSMTICNLDASGDACIIDLYVASQFGTDITDTGTNANETDNYITTSSVTLTVDGTAATADTFVDEKVWKSDGTLFGTCTARNSDTELVFGGGLLQILEDNDSLYTGTRHYILHSVTIPSGTTLVLEKPELDYDSTIYSLKFLLNSVSATQLIDIKLTY